MASVYTKRTARFLNNANKMLSARPKERLILEIESLKSSIISPNHRNEPEISTPAYSTAKPRGISRGRQTVSKPIMGYRPETSPKSSPDSGPLRKKFVIVCHSQDTDSLPPENGKPVKTAKKIKHSFAGSQGPVSPNREPEQTSHLNPNRTVSRVDSVDEPWKRNSIPNMVQLTHPRHNTLHAQPEP